MTEDEDSENDFRHDYFYLKALNERRARDRKEEEKEHQKEVEESVAKNENKKSELLAEIGERLVDIALSENWWSKIRSFIEQGVGNKDCQLIILALKRSNNNVWALHGMLSPFKYEKKGVDFRVVESKEK